MDPEPILAVYTAGKAATTTTHRTLASLTKRRVWDIRRTGAGVEEFRAFAREHFPDRPLRTDDDEVVAVLHDDPGARIKLVTLVREPVAATVSGYFFNFELRNPGVDPADLSNSEHVAKILAGEYASRPDYYVGWFDFEAKVFTGIDVYSRAFPHANGYTTFTADRADLLVIRCEDLDRVFREAFRSFLGLDVPALERHNVGDDASYGDAYRRFKAEATLPTEFVDAVHGTRYARHFYTEKELAAARARWSNAG